jgi:hypothetical protein
MIARRGRDAAPVDGISVKFEVRDGGLHVLRVGDERPRMALFLPRSSGQAGCDRLIFTLLRERHALNCGRPLRAERMVESKWLSRPFWGREGPESGALHRGPPWVLLRSIAVTKTDHHGAARDALATNAITNTAELTLKSQLRSLIEISVAMFLNRRVSSSGLKLGVKCS